MQIIKLVLTACLLGCLFTGCAGNDSARMGDDDGGGGGNDGGNGGGNDDGDTPFTNGVSTLAGMAAVGAVDGPRRIAQFSNPVNVAYHDGTVYVADFDNSKLRAIDGTTHDTTTVIAMASFKRPFGLAVAGDGTLYVSTDNDQAGNHTLMSGTIWKVDVTAKAATPVANAIGRPRGLAVLPDGRLAVADYLHQVIELVDPGTGRITTIAGAWDAKGMVDGVGAAARFSSPYSIAVRADGKLLVTDFDNNRIRLVGLDGMTTTLAGTTTPGFADGAMADAKFSHPQGLSIAANGDVYLTDLGNFRVRRIAGDRVETVAGDGTGGYVDNDARLASELYGLEGLTVMPDGSMLYVADGSRGDAVPYNRVRQIKLN
jgi:sugar lactone lactonase YvrE